MADNTAQTAADPPARSYKKAFIPLEYVFPPSPVPLDDPPLPPHTINVTSTLEGAQQSTRLIRLDGGNLAPLVMLTTTCFLWAKILPRCNPEVMTALIHNLGVASSLSFHDVYSIDDPDLLAFVPRPVYALLLVFPMSPAYDVSKQAEDANRLDYEGFGDGENVIWFKQTIKNACGMFGVLHGVCNGQARSFISMFFLSKERKKKPENKGREKHCFSWQW